MKILVTGANGYLGQGIVKQLLDDGMEVIATDFALDHVDKRAHFAECDLFSIKNPYIFFDKPDILLHLAWEKGFVHNDISHIENLPKHYTFIKKCIDEGIKQIAILGTMHEIGYYEGAINENTPTNPQSLYGIAKDALRKSVFLAAKDMDVVLQWIRGFYIVGNTKYGCSVFSKIAQAAAEGRETFPFTTGQNQWDFLDYKDFCKQVACIIEQKQVTGIINACSGYPEKLAERVEKFIQDNHYSIRLEYGAFADRPYDSKAVWGDNSKIMEILNEKE